MASRMVTTMVFTIAFFMISLDNVHLATAQLCGANLWGLRSACQHYYIEPNSPPPPEPCCALIRPINLTCACGYVSWTVTKLVDMKKVVSGVRSCGLNITSGYVCGSYTVPAA